MEIHVWHPLVKVRSRRLNILSGFVHICEVEVFGEVLLCHTEVLVLELFYSAFESSVLVSELYELLVHFINCGDLGSDVLKRSSLANLAIFSVRLLHYCFDLG